MKKKFNFKKGEFWDGDEYIIHWLEDVLLEEGNNFPRIKKDYEIIIEVRTSLKSRKENK